MLSKLFKFFVVTTALVLLALAGFSQANTVTTKVLNATTQVILRSSKIDSISNDSKFTNGRSTVLATQSAVKGYVGPIKATVDSFSNGQIRQIFPINHIGGVRSVYSPDSASITDKGWNNANGNVWMRTANDSTLYAVLKATGITPGAYTNVNITTDSAGRIIAIANGTAGTGGAPKRTLNAQTNTAYTIVQADTAKYITANNSSLITISVPDDATSPMVPPAEIPIYQTGAAPVLIIPLNGTVIVNAPKGRFRTASQFSKILLNKISANFWILSGDLDTTATPTLFTNVGTLNAGTTPTGTASSPSVSFHTSGINLSTSETVTAPTNFEVSLDNTSFLGSLILPQTSGIVPDQIVYARIKSSAPASSPSGNIACTSPGAATKNVVISGTVTAATKDSARFAVSAGTITSAGWVNVPGDPSIGVRTATGGLSNTITFTSVATANWLQSSGACAFPQNGFNTQTTFNNGTTFAVYPASVTQENWYEVFRSGGLDTTKPNISIGGLKPNTAYTIELSSSDKFNTTTWTDFFVLGLGTTVQTATINSGTTTTNVGAIFTVTSDQNGIIRIYVIPSAGHSSILGMVNGVVIKEN